MKNSNKLENYSVEYVVDVVVVSWEVVVVGWEVVVVGREVVVIQRCIKFEIHIFHLSKTRYPII